MSTIVYPVYPNKVLTTLRKIPWLTEGRNRMCERLGQVTDYFMKTLEFQQKVRAVPSCMSYRVKDFVVLDEAP